MPYFDNDKYLPNEVSEVFSGNNPTKVMESGRNFALREDFPHKEVTGANLGKPLQRKSREAVSTNLDQVGNGY